MINTYKKAHQKNILIHGLYFLKNNRIGHLKSLRDSNMKVARQYFADHMSLRDTAAEYSLPTYKISGEIRAFKDRFEEIMEGKNKQVGEVFRSGCHPRTFMPDAFPD